MKKILLFAISILTSIPVEAQSIDLTEEQQQVLISRVKDKLEDFQYFLQTMADRKNSQNVRKESLNSTINLFIGSCEPYEVLEDWSGTPKMHPAVKMETSSLRGTKQKQSMKQYLNRIFGGLGYSNIKIEQSDFVTVDNIRKVGEGKYMAVAHIYQTFIGYGGNENRIRYADETHKKVIIHIDLVDIPSENTNEGILYDVKLGDMSVVSTSRIK